MTPSPKFSLNLADIKTVAWGILALGIGWMLVGLMAVVTQANFGTYTPVVLMAVTAFVHMGIQWLKANDTNLPEKDLIDAIPGSME